MKDLMERYNLSICWSRVELISIKQRKMENYERPLSGIAPVISEDNVDCYSIRQLSFTLELYAAVAYL